jgi:hypothetical protein
MADSIEPEVIPDADLLLNRVHYTQVNIEKKRVARAVFDKINQSVDWAKYAKPQQTVARHKNPSTIWGVVSVTAEICRKLGQEVVHDPLGDHDPNGPNYAHSEIRGEKTNQTLSRLRDAIVEVWENPLFIPRGKGPTP